MSIKSFWIMHVSGLEAARKVKGLIFRPVSRILWSFRIKSFPRFFCSFPLRRFFCELHSACPLLFECFGLLKFVQFFQYCFFSPLLSELFSGLVRFFLAHCILSHSFVMDIWWIEFDCVLSKCCPRTSLSNLCIFDWLAHSILSADPMHYCFFFLRQIYHVFVH